MTKTKIKDIFNGKSVCVWEDNKWIFFSTAYCTINIPKEEWIIFKKDLEKIVDL